MEEQEIKEMREFSLAALPLVTGFCFLSFYLLLRILDGVIINLFLWIGLATFVLGIFAEAAIFINKKKKTSKNKAAL